MINNSIRKAALAFSKRTRKRLNSENRPGLAGAIRYIDSYGDKRVMILDGYIGVDYLDDGMPLEEVSCEHPYHPEYFQEILAPETKGDPMTVYLPQYNVLHKAIQDAKDEYRNVKVADRPVFVVRLASGHYLNAQFLMTFEELIGYKPEFPCNATHNLLRPIRYYSWQYEGVDDVKAIILPMRYTGDSETAKLILDLTER